MMPNSIFDDAKQYLFTPRQTLRIQGKQNTFDFFAVNVGFSFFFITFAPELQKENVKSNIK